MNAFNRLSLGAALAVAAILLLPQSQGQVLEVSNLSAPNNGAGELPGTDAWWAQSFTMPAGGTTELFDVGVKLAREPIQFSGDFTISLWSSTGSGTPPLARLGNIVAGQPVGSVTTEFVDYTFAAPAGLTLAPNTSYFVVMEANVPSANSGLYWGRTQDANPGNDGPGTVGGFTKSVNSGSSWDAFLDPSSPFQFEVTAVPEPRLIGLVAGMLLLGFGAFRRMRLR